MRTAEPRSGLATTAIWLLCLAPITFGPGLDNRWLWTTLLCTGTAALVAAWAPSTGRLPSWFSALIAGVVVLLLSAALVGADPLGQLLGRTPRYEGLVALPALVAAGWAAARLLGPQAEVRAHRHVITALSVASLLLAAVAMLESVGLRPLESDLARPGSLAGNATDQGILGAVFVGVLGSVVLGAWRRTGRLAWWAVAGAAAGVVSVATSASRAALLALALVAVALIVRFVAGSPRRVRDGLIATSTVIAAGLMVVAVPLTRDRLFGASAFARQTVADRLYMWDDAWQLFLASPWLGVGPSGFADAITPRFGDEWFARAQVGAILDSPHNVALQALVAAGIPGFVAAAAIVGGAFVLGIRHLRTAATARRDLLFGAIVAVPAAGVALLTHVTAPVVLVPLAMLVGMLVAVNPCQPEPRIVRGLIAAALAIWLVFVLASTAADAAQFDGRRAVMGGNLDRALASFQVAQTLRPWDADVALTAAQSLGAAVENGLAGAADPAWTWAEDAVARLPHSSRANYVAGMVAVGRGAFDVAEEFLARAAELSPADPRVHHELGVARLLAGDPAGARAPLERAIELAPDSRATWIALRDACLAVGDNACVERAAVGAG